jgi:gamma-glutamyltranspeptidase/glutathione hydrolase
MLKGDDIAALDPTGPDFVHLVVEALKLAMIDRDAWYADPDFVDVPIKALLSDEYAAARRRLIGETASHEMRPGAPDGRTPRLATVRAAAAAGAGVGEPTVGRLAGGVGEPTLARDGEAPVDRRGAMAGDTCHVDVIDRWGNMVSATPSGGWLQSSPVIPALGFGLGTRAQMFWLEEGLPTSLAPGRRPRTTLSPSFVFKDGKPYMPFGTPGGDQQDQWQTIFFLRHAEHGLNLQEAIDAPSFHTEHVRTSFYPRPSRPGVVVVEGRAPTATIEELRRRGHVVEVGELWSEGRLSACAAERTEEGTILKAGANPRGMQGYAVGR